MKFNSNPSLNYISGFRIFAVLSCFIFGVVLFIIGLNSYIDLQKTLFFSKTTGKIIYSDIKTYNNKHYKSYSPDIKYEYYVNGEKYINDKIWDRDYYTSQRWAAQWKNYYPVNKKIQVLYKKNNPQISVLQKNNFNKNPITIIIGIFFMLFSIIFYHREKKNRQKYSQGKFKPFLRNADNSVKISNKRFPSNEIKSSKKSKVFLILFFAVFWNLLSSPVIFSGIPEKFHQQDYIAVMVMTIFPVAGIGLIIWAIYTLLQWLKYKDSILKLDTFPGKTNDYLEGKIVCSNKLKEARKFKITLSNINRFVTGSGKNRTTHNKVLWKDEKITGIENVHQDSFLIQVPFKFFIPADSRPSDYKIPSNIILWQINMHCDVPGIDFDETFEIPVIKGEKIKISESDDGFDEEKSDDEQLFFSEKDLKHITISNNNGSLNIYVSPKKFLFTGIGTILFSLIFLVPGILVYIYKQILMILIGFSFFGVLIFLFGLYYMLKSINISIDSQEITINTQVLLFLFTKKIPMNKIKDIKYKITSQQTALDKVSCFYSIEFKLFNNKKYITSALTKNLNEIKFLINCIKSRIN